MDWFDGIPVNLERLNLGKMSAEGPVKSAVTTMPRHLSVKVRDIRI
jgi:hypothetical protein